MTWKVNIDLEFLEEIRSFPEETQTRIFFMVSILEIDGPELGDLKLIPYMILNTQI